MTATCRRSGCPRKAKGQGYCTTHYSKLRAAGQLIGGYVDPGPIRARIEAHLERGENLGHLATLAGWNREGLHGILRRRNKGVRIHPAHRLMAVPLPPTHIGTVRRLQALARLGHTQRDIATAVGVSKTWMQRVILYERFHAPMRFQIRSAYEQLSGTPGTSPQVNRLINRAQRNNWVPPLAWDDVDIDDPAAVPDLGPETRITAADKAAEIEAQLLTGESLHMACQSVGIKPETLTSIRWRAAAREAAA